MVHFSVGTSFKVIKWIFHEPYSNTKTGHLEYNLIGGTKRVTRNRINKSLFKGNVLNNHGHRVPNIESLRWILKGGLQSLNRDSGFSKLMI